MQYVSDRVVASAGRVLLHKGGANTVLPIAIVYRTVSRYGHWVSCTVPWGVYRDTPVHRWALLVIL